MLRKGFFFVLACFSCTGFAQEAPLLLTVEECVQRAFLQSNTVAAAAFRVHGAIATKNLVRSAFLPQVDLEAIFDNSNHSLTGGFSQFQNFEPTKAIGLTAIWGIWDFGATWLRFKASRLRIDASEMEQAQIFAEVEEKVREVYFSVLEKEKSVSILESSVVTLREQVAKTTDMFNQGLVKSTDVLSIQVQQTEKEKRLLQTQHELVSHRMLLNQLIGAPLCEIASLIDVCSTPCCFSADQATAFALQNRPDLRAFHAQLDALLMERKGLLLNFAPKIYAFTNGNFASNKSVVSAGIGIKMPLYHGGAKMSELQQINAQIGELEAMIAETQQMAILEIKNLQLTFNEIQQSLYLDERSIALAEQNFQDSTRLYEQDLLSIQDVLLAEDQLNFAKQSYFSNLYQSHKSSAHLTRVTGGYCKE